mmetsp:Transcript_4866/g.7526  ORF Transcript_4866/g.7526 Transcript_4866/m.7526 type:complete len:105 (+) Transcript_4866:419-733(+)
MKHSYPKFLCNFGIRHQTWLVQDEVIEATKFLDIPQSMARNIQPNCFTKKFTLQIMRMNIGFERPPGFSIGKTHIVTKPDVLTAKDTPLRAAHNGRLGRTPPAA